MENTRSLGLRSGVRKKGDEERLMVSGAALFTVAEATPSRLLSQARSARTAEAWSYRAVKPKASMENRLASSRPVGRLMVSMRCLTMYVALTRMANARAI